MLSFDRLRASHPRSAIGRRLIALPRLRMEPYLRQVEKSRAGLSKLERSSLRPVVVL